MQQNYSYNVESAQKWKMHVDLARLHLQHLFFFFLSHNSFAECFTKKKTDNTSIILRRITKEERARAVGMLQQYVSITLPVCIDHRSLNAGVRNAWRPENDEFSLVYRKRRHLSAGNRDL